MNIALYCNITNNTYQ